MRQRRPLWLEAPSIGNGKNYTPYSLRHAYATFRLLYGRVGIHTLARTMGTSVEMVERHYSHITPALSAEELTTKSGRT